MIVGARRVILTARMAVVLGCACAVVAGCGVPRGGEGTRPRDDEIAWPGKGGGFAFWGDGGEYVYAVSVNPRVLEVFKWSDATLKLEKEVPLERNVMCVQLLSSARYVARSWHPAVSETNEPIYGPDSAQKTVSILEIKDLKSGRRQTTCALLSDGIDHNELSKPSGNGKHVVFWRSVFSSRLGAEPHSEVRFARIDTKTGEVEWVGAVTGRTGADATVRTVIPSNEGAYIAVAGWDNGVVVLDVAEKKVLWARGYETDCDYIAFTPDSSVVYAGGMVGLVYGMEVKTGKILSKWPATESGKEEYGHRISTISVSPDGRFVAAGTGPEGQVFVFSTKTGKLVKLLDHAGSTILITSFSPGSKRLASVAAGRIKIWTMPEDNGPAAQNAAPKDK